MLSANIFVHINNIAERAESAFDWAHPDLRVFVHLQRGWEELRYS